MSRVIFTEELIRTFKKKVSTKYPSISSEDMDKICRAQFQMIKEVMQSGSLEPIRLQFLFLLRVSPQKVLKQLKFMEDNRKVINPYNAQHYLTLILNYVNKNQKLFQKYDTRISKLTGFSKGEIRDRKYISNGPSNTAS